MHLTEMKSGQGFKLKGISIELRTVGNDVAEARLSDGENSFILKQAGTYSDKLIIYRAEQFRKEKRWIVEGELDGFTVSKAFDTEYNAKSFLNTVDYDKRGSLKIVERDVEIDTSATSAPTAPDMPF